MKGEYDPMVTIAANRGVVRLRSGRCGTLVYWDSATNQASVRINRTTLNVRCDDVSEVLDQTIPN